MAAHFNRYVRKYSYRTNSTGAGHVPAGECVRRLESSMAIGRRRDGKAYKQWISTRARAATDDLSAYESGAVLVLRDVVRDYLRQESSPHFMVSLNESVAGVGPHALTVEDLVADESEPGGLTAERELRELASRLAGELAATLQKAERVALVARRLELPFHHHAIERAAGCRRSSISESCRKMVGRVVATIGRRYKSEDADTRRRLVLLTLGGLSDAAVENMRAGGSEPEMAALLGAL